MVPTNCSGCFSSACAKADRAVDFRSIGQLTGCIDRRRPLPWCATPRSRRSSRARSPSGSITDGSSRRRGSSGAPPGAREPIAPFASSPFSVSARHIRRRRWRRRPQNVFENPLAAENRRRSVRIRGDRQHAALAEQAAAILVGQRHAPELAAVDIRECRSAAPAARSRTCSSRSADRARCGPRA